MRKKLLITGASGWIGGHVLQALQSEPFEVHAFTSRPRCSQDASIRWHTVDLHDHEKVRRLVDEIQATHLLHLAWYVEHGLFWTAPQNILWVESSLNLVRAFVEKNGQRVVITGSCAEYAWDQKNYDEKTALFRPKNLYGACKKALHQILEAYCAQIGISFAWGYIFHLFGPGEHNCRFVPQIIAALLNSRSQACSSGLQHRDFIYVKDLANALVHLLNSLVEGGVNLATGQAVTLKEMALKIAEKMDKPKDLLLFGQHATSQNDPEWLVATTNRLNEELLWRPKYTLDRALEETIAWWKMQQSV